MLNLLHRAAAAANLHDGKGRGGKVQQALAGCPLMPASGEADGITVAISCLRYNPGKSFVSPRGWSHERERASIRHSAT